MKRLAIIGSRSCPYVYVEDYIDFMPECVVSGGAVGADRCARDFAIRNNIPLKEFLPDYDTYGRQAPLVRNSQIIDNADAVLAFWDGVSHGTIYTVNLAKKKGIPVKIIRI